jgi:YVTN family beta-propeller protein
LTFAGLPEGSPLPGLPLRITYTGGDGNDVSLIADAAPTITGIGNQSTNEDGGPLGPFAFTVGDDQLPATSLGVMATSSNQAVVPTSNLTLGGSGAARTITVLPAANAFGSTIITLTVSDGLLTKTTTFTVDVASINDAPTVAIANLHDYTIVEDRALPPLATTLEDVETAPGDLIVTVASSNQTLVPNGNVVLSGSGGGRQLTVTPLPDATGATTITIEVSDGDDTDQLSFVLTVVPQPSYTAAAFGLSATSRVWIHDTGSRRVESAVDLGTPPGRVAATPDGRHAYVSQASTDTVALIDVISGTKITEVPAGGDVPLGVALTPDGRRLFVANNNSGTVTVIDTTTHTLVGDPSTWGGSPMTVAVSRAGDRVYVTNLSPQVMHVIDATTTRLVDPDWRVFLRPRALR